MFPSRVTSRHGLTLILSLLASVSAWAQFQPAAGNALPAGVQLPGQNASPGPAAQAGLGTQTGLPPQPGLLQMPSLTPRADLGAADAQRDLRTPLRAPKPQAPSQFQRFVQESTGKLLPHFGATLFENPLAYAADAAAPAPAEYVLGPGDEVRIQIWGTVDFAGNQTLDRNGQINLPKIGAINLGGVQVKDLEATLRKQVATVFTNVNVNAALGKLRGITVYVVGQAQQPGTYNLSSLSTLVNAVFASGGPGNNGSMRAIELKRGGKTVTVLDLYDFIGQGDKSKDVALQPGDVIVIPPAGPRIALTGATDHGAIYEIKPDTTVKDVLMLGGGVPALASAQNALVERIDPQQSQAPRQVNKLALTPQGLGQTLRDGDIITLLPMSPAFSNAVTLQGNVAQALRHAWTPGMRVQDLIPDRDALISPDFYKRRNQLVQNRTASLKAQGFTAEQIQAMERAQLLPDDVALSTEIITRNPLFGQQAWGPQAPQGAGQPNSSGNAQQTPGANNPQSPEQDLQALRERQNAERQAYAQRNTIDRVRGFTEQINWDYAVIERLNKAELRTELIPFNLGKAVVHKDPAHNLLLQPGDVITIMSSADLRLPTERQSRLVRIEGEVAAPGVYQALPGETLPQMIQRVGGLTPQAYLYGAEFTRESVRKQQQQNLDQLVRRLEAQMQSAGATLTANLTGERALQATTLQQQQQQQMKSQIDRLKTLRSKGRVALELDPGKTAKMPAAASSDAAAAGQALIASGNKASDVSSPLLQYIPNLPLEDGDAFMVPSQPAFVAAAGSVNNDNVFVYKAGKTVGDIIRAAGLSEDAEPTEAFVLRADGSVLSRRSAGWFSTFEGTRVMPGDTVVVPPKVDRENSYNFVVRALRDWTQIFSNLGIGAAAIKTLRN